VSSLLFPYSLPGIKFDYLRRYEWSSDVQQALSGKTSSISNRAYPLVHFEYAFEFLRDYNSPSADLQALTGLINAVGGRYDTFLHTDPDFNTVTNMPFAIMDGVTPAYQTTATYGNVGGPGSAEIIQNFNGTPAYFVNRYGPLMEPIFNSLQTNYLLHSQDFTTVWTTTNVSVALGGIAAPDGTATADVLTETSTSNVQHGVGQSITVPSTALRWTLSCFVRAINRTFAFLQIQETLGGTSAIIWFNLTTGAVGTISTGTNWSQVAGSIQPADNVGAWYRLTVSGLKTNAATTISAFVASANADNQLSYAGTVSNAALNIWGAQLEQTGVNPTFYLPTTTALVSNNEYALGPTGIITPSSLVNGNTWKLAWSGSFYYRCRFDKDYYDFQKFMKGLWKVDKVAFTSVTL
jgi:hypothetical protein